MPFRLAIDGALIKFASQRVIHVTRKRQKEKHRQRQKEKDRERERETVLIGATSCLITVKLILIALFDDHKSKAHRKFSTSKTHVGCGKVKKTCHRWSEMARERERLGNPNCPLDGVNSFSSSYDFNFNSNSDLCLRETETQTRNETFCAISS